VARLWPPLARRSDPNDPIISTAFIGTPFGLERRCRDRSGAASLCPGRFQGKWNSNLKDCGTNLNDSQLTISAERIRFHENGGSIKAVVTQGEFDLALITELSGEGETWLAYDHFRLSDDQKSLTDVTDGSKLVRYRCPKGAK
jgi:hypothetical protein